MKLVLSLAIFVSGVFWGTIGETSTTTRRVGTRSTSTTTHGLGAYDSASTTTRRETLSARIITITVPPEEDPSKFKEQNATRVVEMNATQWVKWRTYNVTEYFGYTLWSVKISILRKR
uniref:Putative lipocalin n=1 Tax=Ixodes ricinus TaxID=34613 RepID=V5GN53_IXORI